MGFATDPPVVGVADIILHDRRDQTYLQRDPVGTVFPIRASLLANITTRASFSHRVRLKGK